MIERGEIRWLVSDARDKRRPVLVLGRDEIVRSMSEIPVIPMTTQARGLPWEVALDERDGLKTACVLKPEWIRCVHRGRLGAWIASLGPQRWSEVRIARPYGRNQRGRDSGPRCPWSFVLGPSSPDRSRAGSPKTYYRTVTCRKFVAPCDDYRK